MGRITLPEPIVYHLLAGIHRRLTGFEPYEKLFQNRQNIQQVTFDEGVLKLNYEWDLQDARNLKTQIQKNLIPLEHQARIQKRDPAF